MSLKFNEKGQEIPDPTPVELPAGFKKPETLVETMRRMIRTDMSRMAAESGFETFDEANDFDVDDDDAELSPTHHELHEEVVDEVRRFRRERSEEKDADADHGRGGDDGKEAEEGGADGVQEEAAWLADRAGAKRKKSSSVKKVVDDVDDD